MKIIAFAFLVSAIALDPMIPANGQQEQERQVIVTSDADDIPNAYGAPPDLSHGRISTLTKSYVLSPFNFEVENDYIGSGFRHGTPAHVFGQEIEMGLPGRFTVGVQNQIEHFDGQTSERAFTIEGRYAFANWNKIPLNPAVSAEYRLGLNDGLNDSAELALLVSHDFPNLVEWAANIFVEREFGADRFTAAGFAQSVEIPVLLPKEKLEVGLEMQYRSGGNEVGSIRSTKGVQLGPTLAWRPNKNLRFDISPLFGCSHHTPAVELFAVFSLSLGKTEAGETEMPASSRGR